MPPGGLFDLYAAVSTAAVPIAVGTLPAVARALLTLATVVLGYLRVPAAAAEWSWSLGISGFRVWSVIGTGPGVEVGLEGARSGVEVCEAIEVREEPALAVTE